jgi:putative ABC transport system substrate-binding protein
VGPIRLAFIITLVLGGLFGAVAVEAQEAAKVARIGYLVDSQGEPRLREAFRQGLRDLGYVEGRNLVTEIRSAEGKRERLPALAAELVALNVDVIVAPGGTASVLAAKQATGTLPIVFTNVGDPVASGLVTSLARPGGNVTGLSIVAPELVSKRLELLTQAVPESVGSLSSGSQVSSKNGRKRTCCNEQKSPDGRWGYGFNSLRREVRRTSTGPFRR